MSDKGLYIDCPHCGGTGRVKHRCDYEVVDTDYYRSWAGHSQSLTIRRCRICGDLIKVRHQFSDGTGSDTIELHPGESERGYSFTEEEAKKYRKETERDRA